MDNNFGSGSVECDGDGHDTKNDQTPTSKKEAKFFDSKPSINDETNETINDGQPNKPLNVLEKKFLLAVERGDLPAVKRMIQAKKQDKFNINCCDPLGRSGLLMAIDNENFEMIEILLAAGVEMKDALLHAINEEFVEAVELLLDHENLIHVPGTPNSWEAVERETFTADITPLVLAAHRNNYEIIKIILDRNISPIPTPHRARCGCKECRVANKEDCLRHSRSRINAYKALCSPSLIALYSKDPILTAFELSWQLRRLSFLEPEFKNEYLELRKQCQLFATALLDHTRTSEELEILLDYDPDGDGQSDNHGRQQLSRLKLAIKIKQKMFCAHANVQQLLASIWYEGLPGFRRKNIAVKFSQVIGIGVLFPLLSMAYILAPYSTVGKLVKKPFIKFICHSASYVTFLILLILASQRIESTYIFGKNPIIVENGSDHLHHHHQHNSKNSIKTNSSKRGALPSTIELCILTWVFGLIWSEIKQLWDLGINEYLTDMWNILDFINNSIYVATITLRVIAYQQTQKEISSGKPLLAYQRENWDDFDPMLLSEGLFATANIFSALKLLYIFSVNPYLGPLQISLGRMIIDILKFFFFYLLVLFSFACGMNQLLWYYADMEKQSCLQQQLMINSLQQNHCNDSFAMARQQSINEVVHLDACVNWRRFANLFESTQTLFWATFGLTDLDNFELTGIKSYTRFCALVLFGVYCICNVAVLLNLLIAMMNHSYQLISEQADTEWKFARSKLWISYFGDGATVPPPFNIIPTPKSMAYMLQWLARVFCAKTKKGKNEAIKINRQKQRKANERDLKYYRIVRALIRRYVMNEQRIQERQRGVTEDDCNEIKQEISALRYDLLEMLGSASSAAAAAKSRKAHADAYANVNCNNVNNNGSCQMGKRSRQRERRLLKGFNFDALMDDRMASLEDDTRHNNRSPSIASININNNNSKNGGKFPRSAQPNLAGRHKQQQQQQRPQKGAKWRQFIEHTRNKVMPFSRSQDSANDDGDGGTITVTSVAATTTPTTVIASGDNVSVKSNFFNVNHHVQPSLSSSEPSTSIPKSMVNDVDSKRQIFANRLGSLSFSQSIPFRIEQQPTACCANNNDNNHDNNVNVNDSSGGSGSVFQ